MNTQEPIPQESASLPELRREVVVARERPRRAGVWLGACMFAGILAGFSVKTIAISQSSQIHRTQMVGTATSSDCSDGCAWLGIAFRGNRGRILITEVYAGSSAAAAGLKPGDRIISVAGRRMRHAAQVVGGIRAHEPGQVVELEVQRATCSQSVRKMQVSVELGEIDDRGLRRLRRR